MDKQPTPASVEEIKAAAIEHVKRVGGNNACYDSFIAGAQYSSLQLEGKERELQEYKKDLVEQIEITRVVMVKNSQLQSQLLQKETEVKELKACKESAISVMPDIQAIGKALGVKLGESIHDKILPGIEYWKALAEAAEDYIRKNSGTYTFTADQTEQAYKHWQALKSQPRLPN